MAASRSQPEKRNKKRPPRKAERAAGAAAHPARPQSPKPPHPPKAAKPGKAPGARKHPGPPRPPRPPKPAPPPPPPSRSAAEGPRRAGTVAILGRPNVGKSTLLNTALEQPLSIVSPTPQTTRDAILGVVHHGAAEIALLDTPGLHRPRNELGRVMNASAREAARSASVVVFVAEVPEHRPRRAADDREPPRLSPHPGDLTLLADIAAGKPTVLVLNKIDRIRDKRAVLPLLEAYSRIRPFSALVPASALDEADVRRVLDEVAGVLPEGAWQHGEDDLTDRPLRFFAAEYVREQILLATQAEVPHAVAVVIERFLEPAVAPGQPSGGTVHIDATLCVERQGQKRILIGAGGEMLKRIGTRARMRIQGLTGRKVNLKIWVRVEPEWRQERAKLEELGYRSPVAGEMAVLAELPEEDEGEAPALEGEGVVLTELSDDEDEGGEQ